MCLKDSRLNFSQHFSSLKNNSNLSCLINNPALIRMWIHFTILFIIAILSKETDHLEITGQNREQVQYWPPSCCYTSGGAYLANTYLLRQDSGAKLSVAKYNGWLHIENTLLQKQDSAIEVDQFSDFRFFLGTVNLKKGAVISKTDGCDRGFYHACGNVNSDYFDYMCKSHQFVVTCNSEITLGEYSVLSVGAATTTILDNSQLNLGSKSQLLLNFRSILKMQYATFIIGDIKAGKVSLGEASSLTLQNRSSLTVHSTGMSLGKYSELTLGHQSGLQTLSGSVNLGQHSSLQVADQTFCLVNDDLNLTDRKVVVLSVKGPLPTQVECYASRNAMQRALVQHYFHNIFFVPKS